mmetsp:Transcript_89739/g.205131  ORF Transcript_89739/g.205131 Transcript_89739/m.205131 type:complete len:165 (-) Transcript_89739:53-547(-)
MLTRRFLYHEEQSDELAEVANTFYTGILSDMAENFNDPNEFGNIALDIDTLLDPDGDGIEWDEIRGAVLMEGPPSLHHTGLEEPILYCTHKDELGKPIVLPDQITTTIQEVPDFECDDLPDDLRTAVMQLKTVLNRTDRHSHRDRSPASRRSASTASLPWRKMV